MSGRDRAGCALLIFVAVSSSVGGLWYVRDHKAAAVDARMAFSGTIVGKRIVLPGGKQIYPLRFTVVVAQTDGEWRTIAVDRATYTKADTGMILVRDATGHVELRRAPK